MGEKKNKQKEINNETFLQEALEIINILIDYSDLPDIGKEHLISKITDLNKRITISETYHRKVMHEQLERARALEKSSKEGLKRTEALVSKMKAENLDMERKRREKGPRLQLPESKIIDDYLAKKANE